METASESRIVVRPYRADDLVEAVEVWHMSKRSAFPYVQVQQAHTIQDDKAHFQQVIAKECQVWLAEKDTRIVGLMAVNGELIDQLFVGVGEQRRGIGSLLVRKARELSPNGLRAYTFQKNSAARSFF